MAVSLILGGARSGKSAYAEKMAMNSGLAVTYLATAQVYDDEFRERVSHHKARRPSAWRLIESPFALGETLKANANPGTCIIVDCLTLWLAQCICPDCEHPEDSRSEGERWMHEREQFLQILPDLPGEVILVSNEVGMGIVPLGEINRRFQDEQGRLNQAVAAIANRVVFVAAGLPLSLK